jgi:Lanthionine synthetase C-like protein/Protein kinase domain
MTVGFHSHGALRGAELDVSEDELIGRARSARDTYGRDWELTRFGMWVRMVPPGAPERVQGWKLHVSAMPESAPAVLDALLPVLMAEGQRFKFAATKELLAALNDANGARGSAGKFVTVYPADDEAAVRVAERCHEATLGLVGPRVLSDRPLRPGSLVHYRYGSFAGETAIDVDGQLLNVIRDPDGNPVPDVRRAWFSPPPWAADPFQRTAPAAVAAGPRSVLLNDRYEVAQAIRHQNKGGVYVGSDHRTGRRVLIKEGRPHLGSSGTPEDAVSLVAHEARALRRLERLGLTPAVVDEFEQQGHRFLVEEYFQDATTLREFVERRMYPRRAPLGAGEVRRLVRLLADMVRAVNAAGLVLRDFSPNNVLVLPDRALRLVDLGLAYFTDEEGIALRPSGTPGYCSPQQAAGAPPTPADDAFSLGATIVFAATGLDPYIGDGTLRGRLVGDRLADWLDRLERDGILAAELRPIAEGCLAAEPDRRWSADDVLAALAGDRPVPPRARRAPPDPPPPETLAREICAWLVETATPADASRLWPTTCQGATIDPCSVQTGASGVGLFLLDALDAYGGPEIRAAIGDAASWVVRQLDRGLRRELPGLYFGLGGVAWFLAEAGLALDDPALLRRSSEVALACATDGPIPDVTHGAAGAGLAQLHQWAVTREQRFLDRAAAAAEHLLRASRATAAGRVWPVPEGLPSRFAGMTSYGFAHGSAGICAFLLAAAGATGERRFLEAAVDGLDELVAAVEIDGDAALWPAQPGIPSPSWPLWCHGSSGIATALLRGYRATGDRRYRELAELSGNAVERVRWNQGFSHCHGLAGSGQLLLDLADVLEEPRYRARAGALTEVLWHRRVEDRGRTVFPDETNVRVSADWGLGLAGTAAFLLRLHRGGPRPLMLDDLAPGVVVGSQPTPIHDSHR